MKFWAGRAGARAGGGLPLPWLHGKGRGEDASESTTVHGQVGPAMRIQPLKGALNMNKDANAHGI